MLKFIVISFALHFFVSLTLVNNDRCLNLNFCFYRRSGFVSKYVRIHYFSSTIQKQVNVGSNTPMPPSTCPAYEARYPLQLGGPTVRLLVTTVIHLMWIRNRGVPLCKRQPLPLHPSDHNKMMKVLNQSMLRCVMCYNH